jgi:hypothetical protein
MIKCMNILYINLLNINYNIYIYVERFFNPCKSAHNKIDQFLAPQLRPMTFPKIFKKINYFIALSGVIENRQIFGRFFFTC